MAGITDEGVERLRARIGIPEPHPLPPYYTLPTIDTFRNVAIAYGDDNPLWCDPEYGPTTRWESPIASPVLVGGDTLIGEDEVTAVAPEHAELMKGDPVARRAHVLRGERARVVGAARCRCARTFRRNALVAALDKPSEFARARDSRVDRAGVPRRHRRTALGPVPPDGPHRAREGTRAQDSDDDVVIEPYTDDADRRDRGAVRSAKRARGAEPRWWEDVRRGRRGRPDGEGPADRHRHGVLARGHGHGAVRREAVAARRAEPARASRASSTATS